MKLITFVRESNNFSDILNDTVLKKHLKYKISWYTGLQIQVPEKSEILSYIEIKYGESIVNNIVPDRSPIPQIDYLPKK